MIDIVQQLRHYRLNVTFSTSIASSIDDAIDVIEKLRRQNEGLETELARLRSVATDRDCLARENRKLHELYDFASAELKKTADAIRSTAHWMADAKNEGAKSSAPDLLAACEAAYPFMGGAPGKEGAIAFNALTAAIARAIET